MQQTRSRRKRLAAIATVLGGVLAASGAVNTASSSAATTGTNKVGIVCTTDAAGGTSPSFDLETRTGYINLPDGNTAFMWGYSLAGKPFQHPAPVLCVNEGDTVTVRLKNTFAAGSLGDHVSLAFPGQEGVTADGAPVAPDVAHDSLTTPVMAGQTVTYRFTATHAGTFLYESGTDPFTQVRMGLFGALVVHPTLNTTAGTATVHYAYDRPDSAFMADEEFLVLLSEIDPFQHQAVENGETFDPTQYKPRYWLINGRGFPDSIADNNAAWLPDQPYGALARIHPMSTVAGPAYHPYGGLGRYLNVGTEDYPFHPHGNNGSIIGRDGHPLAAPGGEDLSMEKFSLNIGPGQAWDVLFQWKDNESYDAVTNPVPVTVPNVAAQTFGLFYSGSPYLGKQGTLPPGASTQNQCGEYWIIAHNHALYQITSWGVNMTGPITYMRVDPPLPNGCQS
jgi:FtsP/CotA-like multicopper oxidase with cupredoxin domain